MIGARTNSAGAQHRKQARKTGHGLSCAKVVRWETGNEASPTGAEEGRHAGKCSSLSGLVPCPISCGCIFVATSNKASVRWAILLVLAMSVRSHNMTVPFPGEIRICSQSIGLRYEVISVPRHQALKVQLECLTTALQASFNKVPACPSSQPNLLKLAHK